MGEKIQYKSAIIKQKIPYITELYCDKCKKVIRQSVYDEFKDIREVQYSNPIEWYKVTTGHHDWGHDSIDSIEHFDICMDCIDDVFAEFKDRASGGLNTEYIEINHSWNYNHVIKEGLQFGDQYALTPTT